MDSAHVSHLVLKFAKHEQLGMASLHSFGTLDQVGMV